MQYGVIHMQRSVQSGWVEHTLLSTRLLALMHANHTILHLKQAP